MRITAIDTETAGVFSVKLEPNWFEKLFGVKPIIKVYRLTDSNYVFGGQNIYVEPDGTRTSNNDWIAEAIDKYRRAWKPK